VAQPITNHRHNLRALLYHLHHSILLNLELLCGVMGQTASIRGLSIDLLQLGVASLKQDALHNMELLNGEIVARARLEGWSGLKQSVEGFHGTAEVFPQEGSTWHNLLCTAKIGFGWSYFPFALCEMCWECMSTAMEVGIEDVLCRDLVPEEGLHSISGDRNTEPLGFSKSDGLTDPSPVVKLLYQTVLKRGEPLVGFGFEFPPVTRRGRPLGRPSSPSECQFWKVMD